VATGEHGATTRPDPEVRSNPVPLALRAVPTTNPAEIGKWSSPPDK